MKVRRQVLFVHGAGTQGDREGSGYLVASLRKALGSGYELQDPIMPDPDNPGYAAWNERLERDLEALRDDAILVGHSLGGSILLKCLSEGEHGKRIAGLFLVATPFWGCEGWQNDEFLLREGFAGRLPRIPRVALYHSRDDEEVPFAHLALYARGLPQAIVRELDGRGHSFEKGCRELVQDIVEACG